MFWRQARIVRKPARYEWCVLIFGHPGRAHRDNFNIRVLFAKIFKMPIGREKHHRLAVVIAAAQYATAQSHSLYALALDPAGTCEWQPLDSGLNTILLP